MNLIWKQADFEKDIDFILELHKDGVPAFWADSLYYWYPDLDKKYCESLPENKRLKYLKTEMKKIFDALQPEIKRAVNDCVIAWKPLASKLNDIYSVAFFNNDVSKILNNIVGEFALNPVCPRYIKDSSFSVFYKQKPEHAIPTAFHEMTHFVWFHFWHEYFNDDITEYESPHLKWLLSEIVVETIMRNSKINDICQQPQYAYSYFYNMGIDGRLLFDTMKMFYTHSKTLREFMEQSYKYVQSNEKELRAKINEAESRPLQTQKTKG